MALPWGISWPLTIWRRHWLEFQDIYADRFAKKYGPLTAAKKREVEKRARIVARFHGA